jgi:pyruvate-formate lyase-activating enzyme
MEGGKGLTGADKLRKILQEYRVASLESLYTHQLEEVLGQFSREDLREFCINDPWLSNYVVNIWEFVRGETTLTTYPWNNCIPIVDYCNAACTFCNSWLRGERFISLEEVDGFGPLLCNSKLLGLAGHGEPLLHPQFDRLAKKMQALLDPRCAVYVITNGEFLGRYTQSLLDIHTKTYNISLNAVSGEVHEDVMGLRKGALTKILQAVRDIITYRDANPGEGIQVNISLVLVRQNLHEVARFVELGNELRVNNIYLRTLMPQNRRANGLNYHLLPPYLHPDFQQYRAASIRAIEQSNVRVEADPNTWDTPIFPPQLAQQFAEKPPSIVHRQEARKSAEVATSFAITQSKFSEDELRKQIARDLRFEEDNHENPYNRHPRFQCRFIYYNLNINDFVYRLNPCCYMERVPGFDQVYYDGKGDFLGYWNSAPLVELRRSLVGGPLYSHCRKCPFQG